MGIEMDFVMYTTHFIASEVFEALRAGIKGYILKGSGPDHLVHDIRDVFQGGSHVTTNFKIGHRVFNTHSTQWPMINFKN